jgi:lauroyl/myristoyl acyltransferase
MPVRETEGTAALPTPHHLYLLTVMLVIEAARRSRSPRLVDGLAHGLARLAYRVSHQKRQRMEQSLARIFGPLPDAERSRIVRGAFYTFWDETLSFVPWRAAAAPTIDVSGRSHLEAALAAGHGVVLWESGFFGRRHLAKQALHRLGFPIHQVHDVTHRAGFAGDPHAGWVRDSIVLAYFDAREREFTAGVIHLPQPEPLAAIRTLMAALRRNQILCITADVAQGHRLLTVPLLGEPKRFATGMVNVARTCGAALLPLFCVQEPDGHLRVIIEPAIPVAPGRDDETLAQPLRSYAALLGTYIRRYPEQYRNWHYPWWTLS